MNNNYFQEKSGEENVIPATTSFRHSADQPVLESVYHSTTSLLDSSFHWNDDGEIDAHRQPL